MRGIVAGIDTGIRLTAQQSMEIGNRAIAMEYYYQAVSWMEAAYADVVSHADNSTNLAEALEQLETAKLVVQN